VPRQLRYPKLSLDRLTLTLSLTLEFEVEYLGAARSRDKICLSLDHLLSDCARLPAALIFVNNLRKQWSLRPEELLFPHPELGI
jgi:hypothetical protein